MSSSKPIKLYSHATVSQKLGLARTRTNKIILQGPNPWKVVIILEELDIPYETQMNEFPALKQEPFVSINPNGRVPAIEDPNTGIKLWEVGRLWNASTI